MPDLLPKTERRAVERVRFNCSTGIYGCEARASGGGNITGFTCFRVVAIKRRVTPDELRVPYVV